MSVNATQKIAHADGRRHIHRRSIAIDAWIRPDGQWDIEGELTDLRSDDYAFVSGVRPAGQPIHHMWMRAVVDGDLVLREIKVSMYGMPYPDTCQGAAPGYERLVGVSIRKGFKRRVMEFMGGPSGCSHLTHLVLAIGEAAYQSVARPPGLAPSIKRHALDGCFGLASDGEVVRVYRDRIT